MMDALSNWLLSYTLRVGPWEYVAFIVLLLAIIALLTCRSLLHAAAAAGVGLLIGQIGTEAASGFTRFTESDTPFADGLSAEMVLIALVLFPRALSIHQAPFFATAWCRRHCTERLRARLSLVWRALLLVASCTLLPFDGIANAPIAMGGALVALCLLGILFFRLGVPSLMLYFGFTSSLVLEEHLRRALLLARGDWGSFLERPITLALFAMVAVGVLLQIVFFRWASHRASARVR